MAENTSQTTDAYALAADLGFNLSNDYQYAGLSPRVGQGYQHKVNSRLGEDYYTVRIDYGEDKVVASRVFAIIMEDGRCGSAYLPKKGHAKKLAVIRGCGLLILGNPENDDLDGAFMTDFYPLKAGITEEVTLPRGYFYTVEAKRGEVVVSYLSEIDVDGNWEPPEIAVEPGKESFKTPEEGLVIVPEEFMNANFN